MCQFSWYLRVALPNEFTSSTKKDFDSVTFLTETENRRIHES